MQATERVTLSICDDTLSLSGVLNDESVLQVDAQGQAWLLGAAPKNCKLNLEHIHYSNSAGIVLLLGWLRTAQQQQKTLRIIQLPNSMAALISVGGLQDFFSAYFPL
jgi:anti-anti-sigma factor